MQERIICELLFLMNCRFYLVSGGEIRGNVSAFLELVLKPFVHVFNVASSSLDCNYLITL